MTKADLGLYCYPLSILLGLTYDNLLVENVNMIHAGVVLVLASVGIYHLMGLPFGFTFQK